MNLLSEIKIGGHNYKINTVSSVEIERDNGQTWLQLHEIKINKDIPKSRQESVALHEILEIINHHYGLNLEHEKIEILEEVLYQILKDNFMEEDRKPACGL